MLMSTGMLAPISAMFLARPRPVLLLVDQHELPGERGGGEGVRCGSAAAPSGARAARREPQSTWSGLRAWKSHTTTESPNCFMASRVLQELPEGPHVVLPARERRREHAVQVDVDPHVVAVGRLLGHPDRPDELAVVAVLGEPGAAAAVLGVGQRGDEHAARQRVERVRADEAAGVLDEGRDRLHQLGLGRDRCRRRRRRSGWCRARPPTGSGGRR